MYLYVLCIAPNHQPPPLTLKKIRQWTYIVFRSSQPDYVSLLFIITVCCLPGRLSSTVVAPGGKGLEGEDAGDVDVDHPGAGEAALEHGVEADHVEEVESVVLGHLPNICQVLQKEFWLVFALLHYTLHNT